jgi:NAD(P)-dependent dehydrogenase (short-subunit alcohol dehydrogenase family)
VKVGRLRGMICVVTGGAQGIGRAIVERFWEGEAAAVAFLDVDHARGTQTADELGAMFIPCDITVENEVKAAVNSILEQHRPRLTPGHR